MSYNSRVKYTGTGGQSVYTVPFPYISKNYVDVRVGGVLLDGEAHYTWPTPTTIHLTAGNLPSGVILDIRRNTPKDGKLVDFQDASVLTEADLDLSADQMFHVSQENSDDMDDRLGLGWDGVYAANQKRIKDVAEPRLPGDAATKEYVDALISAVREFIPTTSARWLYNVGQDPQAVPGQCIFPDLSLTPGNVDVFLNGIKLVEDLDFQPTPTTVTLASPVSDGDVLEIFDRRPGLPVVDGGSYGD